VTKSESFRPRTHQLLLVGTALSMSPALLAGASSASPAIPQAYVTSAATTASPGPHGGIVYTCLGSGAHEVYGMIGAEYRALGGPGSFLGCPTSDEHAVPGGRQSDFAGGIVDWSSATAAHEVHGAILSKYQALGGPGSFLGLPISDEHAVPGGRQSDFAGGIVDWSSATAAHEVHGAILSKYQALGGPGSTLGFPLSDEQNAPEGPPNRQSEFQYASIHWTAASGATTVTPTATPAPTPPPALGFGVGTGRPFASTSAWNSPVVASPVLDGNSGAIITSLTPKNAAYADLYEFGSPIFNSDARTPQQAVNCTMPWGTCDLQKQPIRIPSNATPSTGSDAGMIVIDWVTRLSCDFWQAQKTSSGWQASWGTCASIDGSGSGPSGGGTGAGVNGLAGAVRTYEIAQGKIDHALNFATNNSCQNGYRFPATKTDGSSSRGDCLPEGSRVQLDPSVDVDALPGITPGERAVAHALQTYGAYNRDNGGAPIAFGFEKPTTGIDPYPAAGFAWDYYDMPHIPWNKLRVLRQWDGR